MSYTYDDDWPPPTLADLILFGYLGGLGALVVIWFFEHLLFPAGKSLVIQPWLV